MLATEGNCTKLGRALQANSVLRLMVRGQGHPTTGNRQTRVRLGKGPITYQTGQLFGCRKLVETGTTFYIETKRLVKLVATVVDNWSGNLFALFLILRISVRLVTQVHA